MASNIVVEVRYIDYRWYHTDFKISNTGLVLFVNGIQSYKDKDLIEIGEKGRALVLQTFLINGVTDIHISPFCLSVSIQPLPQIKVCQAKE